MRTTLCLICSIGVLGTLAACGSSSREITPKPPWGSDCTAASGCEGGLLCLEDPRFSDGYCTSVCEDGTCGEGARCIDRYGTPLCLAECSSDGDCRPGYQCWAGSCRPLCSGDPECGDEAMCGSDGRCIGPECATDADCGPGQRCAAGACMAPVPDGGVEPQPNGSPCGLPSDCRSGICLPPALGGVCAPACADRGGCNSDQSCSPVAMDANGDGTADTVASACVTSEPTGFFLAGACSNDDQCESRACIRRQCAESCDDDGDCLPGQECRDVTHPAVEGGSYRGCWYADRSGGTEVVDVDLGPVGVNSGLPSRRFNFGVPNDAISVTLMARRTGGANIGLTFIDVWDPRNDRLFDYSELISWVDQPIRWIPINSEEHISMLVPNTTPDRVNFVRGRHGFTVAGLAEMPGDTRSATVDLTMRVKRARGGDVTSGTLNLNVFLVGVGLTAAQAETNGRLQGSLAELRSILAAAGISIGSVNYIQITGGDATRYSVIDSSGGPGSEMAGLLRLSSSRANQAVNVFLVRRIDASAGESGGIALGIAGGIPGPPGVHGTMHSGVLVSFDSAIVGTGADGQRVVAQIMAHEIGHYLGLYHNREQLAPCPAGTGPTMASPCSPFGGGDVLDDTARNDGRNLMWFALGGADGRTYNIRLSSGQGFVMLRNPVVR